MRLPALPFALGGLLLVVPAAAPAAAPVTSIVSGNVAGPVATFTEVTATADCGGMPLAGGGARLAQATQIVEHNGIHVGGTFPSADGTRQAADGDATPARWIAAGGSGGGVPSDAQTVAYGVCLQAGPATTRVAVASTPGPSGTFQTVHATATCPGGTQLLSGGARTTPGVVGSLKPTGSYPSDAAGTPVLSGANPTSWTAVGLNGGGGDQSNRTYAFALCAPGADLTVTVAHAQVPGPALATTPAQSTVSCPAGTALLGGGGSVSDAFGLPGSQGDHLTGSFPSDAGGTPVAGGSAGAWTVASHTGGVDSGSLTQTDVWAMCASAAGSAPPPATGPETPVNTAPPSITGPAAVGASLTARPGSWTGQPTSYGYQWLRCSATASTCTAIAGAARRVYRLANADIGSRIRVRETATNAAAVRGGRVTAAQLRAQMRRQIVPTGAATKIASMLVRGDTVLAFTALEAGRVAVAWYLPVAHARAILVAPGRAQLRRRPGDDDRCSLDARRQPSAERGAAPAAERPGHVHAARQAADQRDQGVPARTLVTVRHRHRQRQAASGAAAALVAIVVAGASLRAPAEPAGPPAGPAAGRATSFERNVGQEDPRVRFLARGPGGAVYLTRTEAVLVLGGRGRPGTPADVLRLAPAGAARARSPRGALALAGRVNYLIGARRTLGVATYAQVVYPSVYPGIDLRYTGAAGQLQYDYDIAPGGDPGRIAIDLAGAGGLRIDRAGNLRVALAGGTLVERRPVIYQVVGGSRRMVRGGFVQRGPRRVGFAVGRYDRSRLLVIDPTIAYSLQLTGSAPGAGRAIAVDRSGNTYVTGETSSANFPTAHPLQARRRGANVNAFVAKVDPSGALVYATYLGGSRYTAGRGIAVDRGGSAYVTGATSATDFPTTGSAVQRSYGGGPFDAFVTKLNPAGSGLVYSTFLGDTHYDEGNAIAVDAHDRAVVAGRTVSPQFPHVGPLVPAAQDGAFVSRLNRAGTRLVSSAVFGGTGSGNHGDTAFGVAVDRQGATYVTGVTNARDFPTVRPLQPVLGGGADAFVIKIDAASTSVVYSTYLGGAGDDAGRAIAADGDGNAYVAGVTASRNLPTSAPLQGANAIPPPTGADAFVTKIDARGAALVYSTYLGGSGEDAASGLAVDRSRNVYVTGQTASPDFPLAAPIQRVLRGPRDAFVAELDRGGRSLAFSTYFGGSASDAGLAVAVDLAGAIHVAGQTSSRDFPRRAGGAGGPRRILTPGDGAFVTSLRPARRR